MPLRKCTAQWGGVGTKAGSAARQGAVSAPACRRPVGSAREGGVDQPLRRPGGKGCLLRQARPGRGLEIAWRPGHRAVVEAVADWLPSRVERRPACDRAVRTPVDDAGCSSCLVAHGSVLRPKMQVFGQRCPPSEKRIHRIHLGLRSGIVRIPLQDSFTGPAEALPTCRRREHAGIIQQPAYWAWD